MTKPITSAIALVAAIVLVGAGAAWWLSRPDSTPYAVPPAVLEKWTLVTSDGTDPWVVAMKPPEALTASLFADASRRAGRTLVAPAHPGLPLVLRTEFDEALQGVYGTDSVLRIARESGVDTSTFEPVCLARHTVTRPGGRADLYFVPFVSDAFTKVRVDLVPAQPEHGGIGIYEPSTLIPALIVGSTDADADGWWPLSFDRERDCEAPVLRVR
ncbi:MAG: hypothetical protein ABL982_15100 [Vicinamibacterales bacterium]